MSKEKKKSKKVVNLGLQYIANELALQDWNQGARIVKKGRKLLKQAEKVLKVAVQSSVGNSKSNDVVVNLTDKQMRKLMNLRLAIHDYINFATPV